MNSRQARLSVELLRRIDAACDRFEASWRTGSTPRIEEYITLFKADERPVLLNALQCLQSELILSESTASKNETLATTELMSVVMDPSPAENASEEPSDIQPSKEPCEQLLGAHVTFRVIAGPHAGAGFTFREHNTLLAGRLAKAQLRLEKDMHFSRHHFRLEVNPPTCFLMDLNSRNGTFVNGEKVHERFLLDGDIVSGGRTRMLVSIFDPKNSEPENADETLTGPVPKQAQSLPQAGLPASSPPNPPAEPTDPKCVDGDSPLLITGYQIFAQIGTGDLGTVYRAQRLSSQETCALKVLSPAAHSDETSIQTFLREASVLNQLEHPHIIRLIDMGASGRNVYLATEYVKSIAWRHLVSRYSDEKRIRVACGLMGQILAALEYAHARSLVHRDVKPGNILITRKDDKLVAKLSDFGLAKQYTTAGMSHVTRDGDVLGSLPFMSPDQFLNSRDARPACDLYSAGATLYWMLTGREPILLEGHPCKFLAILEDPPTPIRQLNPVISEPLAATVHRALEKTPEKRFASATEMRYQLKACVR